jgi:histidine triad (HIT) family protein
MSDCLFCKMVKGEIKPDVVHEDEHVLAFRDINPQGPVHILVIPKEHIPTINHLEDEHAELIGRLFLAAKKIAAEEGIAEDGYRLVFNCNKHGGQEVYHIHLHIIGGRQMTWPPG